jgi:two-component system sensor histidine kinase UhpB
MRVAEDSDHSHEVQRSKIKRMRESSGLEKGLLACDNGPEVNARWARDILQGMPVLMDAFDGDGCIVVWNAECERVTGYSAAEILGNRLAIEMLYPDIEYRTSMLEEAHRRLDDDYSNVWELTAKDGTRKIVEWFNVGARLKVPGWFQWSIGIDITERRRLESALQEATIREQRRIAAELHDGLGQELSGLSLLASGLAGEHAKHNPKLAHDLRQLAELASQSVTTCRSLAQGLAPLQEHQNSLVDALRRLAIDSTGRANWPTVTFSEVSSAASLISQEANNHLYRIAQEALNNALKHSGARVVKIQLSIDRSTVSLRISDDGHGVDAQISSSFGMGMRTMRDRAAAIGGRLSISTDGQQGTVIGCKCQNRIGPVSLI